MSLPDVTDRAFAEALDAADPLHHFRELFVPFTGPDADELIYLDGNSLGRPPTAGADRLTELVTGEWAGGLVRSWGVPSASGGGVTHPGSFAIFAVLLALAAAAGLLAERLRHARAVRR